MAQSRAQMMKELLPGLNALFGNEYATYDDEHTEIYSMESSDRSFEEEVQLSGFGTAPVKTEGAGIAYDTAQEKSSLLATTMRPLHLVSPSRRKRSKIISMILSRLVIPSPWLVLRRTLSR